MERKVFLLDGATGTELWNRAKKDGVAQVPVWIYNMEHPDYVKDTIRSYVEAGSDIICANTFGANSLSVSQASSYDPSEVVTTGVRLAREAVAGTDVKVALDAGPLTELMEPYGDLEEDEVREIYRNMFASGVSAGADIIFLETFIDLSMLRVAAEEAVTFGVPVFCSLSFEKNGRTIMGNSVEDAVSELEPLGVAALGLNCSLGPDVALPVVREFTNYTKLPILFKPNAGMPVVGADGKSAVAFDAKAFVQDIAPALDFVTYIGGCCGSSPRYIEMLKKKIEA
ncbi:MAG: homocysteine S-methyltransferase family protein [Clostridia bacterium]|nr:homocysteine S-methyltransferase family protein [Clostridia bacterium]